MKKKSGRDDEKKDDPDFWNREGIRNRKKGHLKKAIECYNKAIELKSNVAGYFNNRGIAYGNMKEYDKVIKDYNKAIELKPNVAGYFYNRGNTYDNMKEYDKSIKDYNKAIELKSNVADYFYNRGNTYRNMKEYDKSIKDYNKAIELKPNVADYFNNRGDAYYHMKEYDKAIKDYNKAIELKPNVAGYFNNRGIAYGNMKEYDKVIKDYNKAIELEPNVAGYFNNRGIAYRNMKEYDKAIKDYNKAIELEPNVAKYFNNKRITTTKMKNPLFQKLKKCKVEKYYKYFEKESVSSDKQLLMFLKPEYYQKLETIISNDNDRYKFIENLEKVDAIYEGSYNQAKLYDGFGCLFIVESSFLGFRKKRVKIYEGEFKNGKRSGRGKLFHPNSNKIMFFGSFVNGKKEGIGFEKNLNGKIIRHGKWKEGKLIEEIKVRKDIKEIKDSENMEIFMKNVMNANLTIRKSYILGYGTNTIEYYAFKHFHKVSASEKEIEIFKKEVGLLSNIEHSNIVKIVGVSSEIPIGILTEVCEMNVSFLIKRGIKLSFLEKVKILYQTCLGLEYLHIICIQHRDLKWHNVLITKAQPVRKVKIADFGLAKVKDSFTPTKNSIVGSIEYIAPEVLTEKYSYPSDVFSFGIMIYELLYDTLDPYDKKNNPSRKNDQVLLHLVSKANLRPKIPIKNEVDKDINKWLIDVIQNCVKHKADYRPTFSKIVKIIRKNCSKCVEDILPF